MKKRVPSQMVTSTMAPMIKVISRGKGNIKRMPHSTAPAER